MDVCRILISRSDPCWRTSSGFACPSHRRSASPSASAPTSGEAAARQQQPRVDTNTQRARDDERRRILEYELAAEQEQLTRAQAALAEQESIRQGDERNYARVLERLQPFQEAVAQHEKNIASIKQELSNLR